MRSILALAFIALFLAPAASHAQLALPGAIAAPTPEGQPGARPIKHHEGESFEFGPNFTPAKPPGLEMAVGKPFSLNGSRGALRIEKSGADLRLSRLKLSGDRISQPNLACEVEMGGAQPLALASRGAPDGVSRFELQSSACPLQLDILSGAVRVQGPDGACVFQQADCRVEATGLWGPSGDSFGESQIKNIERDRTTLESSVRAHFRGVLNKSKEDKAAIQAAVKEQAAFSASRAQSCRDYDREDAHGFCALRLTEARDYRLQARLAGGKPAKMNRKPAKKPAPRQPVVIAPPPPAY